MKQKSSIFCLVSALAFAELAACSRPAPKLPDYGKVPNFQMTDSLGDPFNSQSLAGKVWVADFIYTSCPGACPRMTSEMHKISQHLKRQKNVRLVSISVDPAHDSPPVLNAFAHKYGGPTPQWIFLTGTPTTIHLIAYGTFHVGDIIQKMNHSTKFILVDKSGEIRGYYDSFDPQDMQKMLANAEALRKGRA
ncbi:MAG TPA: SCO family protein [Bryobacteraceae bacterium]